MKIYVTKMRYHATEWSEHLEEDGLEKKCLSCQELTLF